MSTVFRVEKNSNYTVISNYHIRDKRLSYKAMGLLTQMLSLPPNWDFTLVGLSKIASDGIDSVRSGIHELENYGYVTRKQLRDEYGRMTNSEYIVYECPSENPKMENSPSVVENEKPKNAKKRSVKPFQPSLENPTTVTPETDLPSLENPITVNPTSEKPTQINTKILNTKILNTEYQSINLDEAIEQMDFDEIDVIDNQQLKRNRETYEQIVRDNISYDYLIENHSISKDTINEILMIMVDIICSTKATVRVNGGDIPHETVKSVFLKLNESHIEYALECLKKTTTKRRNIRAYIITTLYNTVSTIDNYYAAEVNHDFYGNQKFASGELERKKDGYS